MIRGVDHDRVLAESACRERLDHGADGVVHHRMGNYEEAERLYTDAIASYRALGTEGDLVGALLDFGSTARAIKNGPRKLTAIT